MKRVLDIILSFILLFFLFGFILLLSFAATIDTNATGIFKQIRIGKNGKLFNILKIRTMKPVNNFDTNITQKNDPRITNFGRILRTSKVDELPQLWNILKGDMSFVGPRPDVPGYADKLDEKIKGIILSVRPGITGPASLKYRNEEDILSNQDNPEQYNDEIIYPDKVSINVDYIQNWSFKKDLYYIWKTIFP